MYTYLAKIDNVWEYFNPVGTRIFYLPHPGHKPFIFDITTLSNKKFGKRYDYLKVTGDYLCAAYSEKQGSMDIIPLNDTSHIHTLPYSFFIEEHYTRPAENDLYAKVNENGNFFLARLSGSDFSILKKYPQFDVNSNYLILSQENLLTWKRGRSGHIGLFNFKTDCAWKQEISTIADAGSAEISSNVLVHQEKVFFSVTISAWDYRFFVVDLHTGNVLHKTPVHYWPKSYNDKIYTITKNCIDIIDYSTLNTRRIDMQHLLDPLSIVLRGNTFQVKEDLFYFTDRSTYRARTGIIDMKTESLAWTYEFDVANDTWQNVRQIKLHDDYLLANTSDDALHIFKRN